MNEWNTLEDKSHKKRQKQGEKKRGKKISSLHNPNKERKESLHSNKMLCWMLPVLLDVN